MSRSSAYLLVFHGSRDPRPQAAVNVLAELFAQSFSTLLQRGICDRAYQSDATLITSKIATGSQSQVLSELNQPLVATAYLECGALTLQTQIEQFGAEIYEKNLRSLIILPLFLLAGMHVMTDIPREVELAQKTLGQKVKITLQPHLGSHPQLQAIVSQRMAQSYQDTWILLAHGSRRVGANQPIEALANQLNAIAAYWSVTPNLPTQIQQLANTGFSKIGIFPYFLFSGGITDLIQQECDRLSDQFPNLDLDLTSPLDATPELANLLVDLAIETAISIP